MKMNNNLIVDFRRDILQMFFFCIGTFYVSTIFQIFQMYFFLKQRHDYSDSLNSFTRQHSTSNASHLYDTSVSDEKLLK